jgi:hypothetical protein
MNIEKTTSWRLARAVARVGLYAGCLALAGCAGIYLHDADLQTRTDAADAAARAHPIDAAFVAELSQLKDGDQKEALAVAHYMTAVRDRRVAEVAGIDDAQKRAEKLGHVIAQRWGDLFNGPVTSQTIANLADSPAALQDEEAKLAERQQAYLDFHALYRGPLTDLSCKAIATPTPDLTTPLGRMQKACSEMSKPLPIPGFGDAAGPVAKQALFDWREARQMLDAPSAANIDGAIEKVIDDAKNQSDEAKAVDDAAKELANVFQDATAVAALAGWTKLDQQLSGVLTGLGCASSAPDATTCGAVKPATMAGRTKAIVVLAQAIAKVSDAAKNGGKQGFALQAAKAIAAAQKADAQARVDQARALVDLRERRLIALAAEGRYLAEAQAELDNDERGCGAEKVACALTLYGLSWDRGRIPFMLLRFSEDDLARETWVARTRIIANEQEAVLTSATASLKAYGAGGIKPELVAQLLQAAGLGAVAATH